MVLWRYVVFSIVLFVLLLMVFFAALWNFGKYQNVPYIRELAAEFDGRSPSSYAEVDVARRLGKKGYVQILDEENRVIYSNNKKREGDVYTDYEMGFISDYDDHSIVTVEKFKTEDGSTERVVSNTTYAEDGRELKNAVYVVDDSLNILYSTEYKSKKQMTQREYDLLTKNAASKYILSKGHFTDAEGKERILLAYSPKNFKNNFDRMKQAFLNLILVFFAVYALLIFLFSLWVGMGIRKPLKLLNRAMGDISAGNWGTELKYKGSREFVDLCEKFNKMSRDLYFVDQENQRLQRDRQKMVADISHDLKTPITVIKGYAKAICDGLVSGEEQERYLESIYQKSEVLTDLIDEFHEFSKLDHPDNRFLLEKRDICEFTREYFASNYNQFEFSHFELDIDVPERPITVSLDGKKFKRIYDNIMGNFFRHNEPGSTFFCHISQQEGKVRIVLADDGRGIPQEIQETIFEPFVVGEKARTSRGSGLGLSIARKIAEGCGGKLWLQIPPEPGFATEFVVELDCES